VGGIGKTRLALAVAAAVAPSFTDGCWLAELAPTSSEDEVVRAVAAAMGAPARERAELCRYVADRHVLIVLDNCEHVLSDAARLAESLLGVGPEVAVIATSREPLGINGEVVRGVASLAIPAEDGSATDALAASAVRLFVERATAATDRFALDDGNVTTVVDICRQLDGIPLALELAAARIRSMAPAEISRRLSERFRLLAGGRGSLERHRTLLGAVAWSHDLLSDDERRLFRRLAVFPATFDLDAAEAIGAADDVDIDAVDCVLRLVDRSLVTYDAASGRYRLLETLRQFGADRLADAGETIESRDRHAAYYLDVAPSLNGSTAQLWAELENLRAVANWLIDQQRGGELLAMARALFPTGVSSAAGDSLDWYHATLDHLDTLDMQTRVDVLGELGHVETMIGRDLSAARWMMSIALADESGVAHSPWAWNAETMACIFRADLAAARHAGERTIDVARQRHDSIGVVTALGTHAFVLASLEEFDASRQLAQQALHDAQAAGDPESVVTAINTGTGSLISSRSRPDFVAARRFLDEHPLNLADVSGTAAMAYLQMDGTVELGLGRPESAAGRLVEAVRLADRMGGFFLMHQAAFALGVAAAQAGHHELACQLVGCADGHLAAFRIANNLQGWLEARLDALVADVDPVERARATQRGAGLDRRGLMRLLRQAEELVGQDG
jgi:predicted ATPase